MAERRVRVGLIGAGTIARDYLAVLGQIPEIELTCIADTDDAARERVTQLVDLPVYGSVRELIDESEIEAALVLTPPVAHDAVAIELLSRGTHVLCEKPLALSSHAAGRMVHTASRMGVLLMMASKFRYVPDMVEAQRILASDVLGEPILFENSFCAPVDMTERWNSDPDLAGGGVLIDNGCHSVDIARFLLGPIVRVFAHFGRRVQPVRVEDSVRMFVETSGACVGLIDLSWSVDKGTEHYVSVQATRGTLQVGWRGSRYRAAGDADWTTFGAGYDKHAALAAQLRNFAAAVRGDEQPVVTVEEALASVRTIDAAYRAARVGRWVPVQGFGG